MTSSVRGGSEARFIMAMACVLAACTPIRPLDEPTDAGQHADAARADAARADASTPDSGSDAGCSGAELCNGVDDDCDPSTPDGSDEATLGADCDGDDGDLCVEGTLSCAGGVLVCSDETDSTLERCDGVLDEDCDGTVDEGGAEDAMTWYPDVDGDNYGDDAGAITACTRPVEGDRWISVGGDCDDGNRQVRPDENEECNALDDDCNGLIDDGDPCGGCLTRTFGGRVYQLCTVRRTWDNARSSCMSNGYDLVVIEDAAENAFLSAEARATGQGLAMADGWWIGLRDTSLTGTTFTWVDGSTPTYTAWAGGEPNMAPSCGRLRPAFDHWADNSCGNGMLFICELTP